MDKLGWIINIKQDIKSKKKKDSFLWPVRLLKAAMKFHRLNICPSCRKITGLQFTTYEFGIF